MSNAPSARTSPAARASRDRSQQPGAARLTDVHDLALAAARRSREAAAKYVETRKQLHPHARD